MYLHAAANGSRTYGRTGLKCQNGWHALCGMAPTLWSSIRHVDQHGNIARREALPLGFRFCASCRRVGMRYSQNSIEYTVDVHETRVIGIRACLGGRRADRETGVDERPKPRRCGSGRRRSGPGTGPHPPRHA